MKPLPTIIFSALITAAFFWLVPGAVSGDGVPGSPTSVTASNPSSKVASSPPTTAVESNPVNPKTPISLPFDISLVMPVVGVMLLLFWIFRREFGIDHGGSKDESPYGVLKSLIREIDESSGYSRHEARAKAKAWLIKNVSNLDANDIFLAKSHLSYLLPAGWGVTTWQPDAVE